jgi:hypothetical protein
MTLSLMELLVIDAVGCGALGLLIGRPAALAIPIVGWPVYYYGLSARWWGFGVGDGWQFVALLAVAVGVLGVLAGLGARMVTRRLLQPSGSSRR